MPTRNKKQHINPFWGPNVKAKGLNSFGFKPVKLNTSRNIRNIPKRNLTWAQASIRYPRMRAFGDSDRDGILNAWDCKPFDRKRHSIMRREEISQKLYNQPYKIFKKTRKDINKMLEEGNKEGLINIEEFRMSKNRGKILTEKDVIKHFEKHPEQLTTANNMDFATMTLKNARDTRSGHGLTLGRYEYTQKKEEKPRILISPIMNLKQSVGELITHELKHHEQILKRHPKGYVDDDSELESYDIISYLKDPDEIEARQAGKNLKRIKPEEQPEVLAASEKILMRKERKKESGKKYYSKPEIKEKYREGWKKEMKEVKDIINEKTPETLEEESQIYEKEYIPEEKVFLPAERFSRSLDKKEEPIKDKTHSAQELIDEVDLDEQFKMEEQDEKE